MTSVASRLHHMVLLLGLLGIGVALLMSGCLWGVVRDATSGAPISGASVTYTDANGHTGTTTTNNKGWYAFDFAAVPIPAAGPITLDVSASGHDPLSVAMLADYKDNPKASGANPSSFWELQSFALLPAGFSGTVADIAVTDLYPDNQPQGTVWARITNNGPAVLTNNKVDIALSYVRTSLMDPADVTGGTTTNYGISLNLSPGQTQTVSLGETIDTAHYRYDFTATATALDFTDAISGNNTYTESVGPFMGNLVLTNGCGAEITAIQFRQVGTPSWTDMLAFGEVIPEWQTRNWQIPAGTYDLRAYIGQQVLNERLNVGIFGTYDWTVLAALDIWNSPPNWWPIEEVHIFPEGAQDHGPNLLNPGETISPGAVRRFNLATGVYMFLVTGPGGDFPRGRHNAAVAGVCAWSPGPSILDPGVFTCVP